MNRVTLLVLNEPGVPGVCLRSKGMSVCPCCRHPAYTAGRL